MHSDYANTLDKHWKQGQIQVQDSTSIRYAIYSQSPSVDHYLVFLNGHGEFIEKYKDLPRDLMLPSNYGFISWDHRGQGASDGEPRLHIDDYEIHARDCEFLLKHLVKDTPYTLMAHSMGGLISLYTTMRGIFKPDKLLISAPLLGVQHVIPEPVGKALGNWITRLGFGRNYFQKHLQKRMTFKNNMFTHSEEQFKKRFLSPYIIEGITFGWIKATYDAIAYVNDESHLKSFKTPTKILYGDDERLVSTKAIQEWVNKSKACNKTPVSCLELPRTRHEIFIEEPMAYARVLEESRKFLFNV